MRKLSAIIFIFLVQGCSPQETSKTIVGKQIKIDIQNGLVATLENYVRMEENESRLQLPHLLTNKNSIRFRYRNDRGQVVDIWTMDFQVFHGCVTNFADTLNMEHGWESQRTFISKNWLDTATCREVYNIIKPISSIPDCRLIRGWGLGLDGVTHVFEISTPLFYAYNLYWTPQLMDDSVQQAKAVSGIIMKLDSVVGLKAMFERFYNHLPPGRYTICPSYLCSIMKLTKRETQEFDIDPQTQKIQDLKKQRPYLKWFFGSTPLNLK